MLSPLLKDTLDDGPSPTSDMSAYETILFLDITM
jgi:hypothetical protein